MVVSNHWTGILDWTNGLTYFWILNILLLLWLAIGLQGHAIHHFSDEIINVYVLAQDFAFNYPDSLLSYIVML